MKGWRVLTAVMLVIWGASGRCEGAERGRSRTQTDGLKLPYQRICGW